MHNTPFLEILSFTLRMQHGPCAHLQEGDRGETQNARRGARSGRRNGQGRAGRGQGLGFTESSEGVKWSVAWLKRKDDRVDSAIANPDLLDETFAHMLLRHVVH